MVRLLLTLGLCLGCARTELPFTTTNGDSSTGDSTSTGDADIGEAIWMAPGWSVDVYRDFSDEFTFNPNDFPEVQIWEIDNDPRSLLILEPPFEPGLAIVAGRRVMEIRHSDLSYVEHDYTPPAPEGAGPTSKAWPFRRWVMTPALHRFWPRASRGLPAMAFTRSTRAGA